MRNEPKPTESDTMMRWRSISLLIVLPIERETRQAVSVKRESPKHIQFCSDPHSLPLSHFVDNMFFSAHVLRLKQSETGVPSERGSVARLVGTAWKVRIILHLDFIVISVFL